MRIHWTALAILVGTTLWAQGETKVVPGGTELAVRTNESIDSKTAAPGQTFSAQIDKDVRENGAVLIPKGSPVELVVRRVTSGGTAGSADLTLDLQSINVGGRRYTLDSSRTERSSGRGIGKNKRTAEMVGGGAALGTVIGAIAGGGKGAAIGAIAGAAAGGTAQVLTKGKEVRVPAETVLKFQLNQPLRLE